MRGLSCIVPVYEIAPRASPLRELLDAYASFPRQVTERIQFVVVDDGSPAPIEIPDGLGLDILHARILEDIPWNNPGAKNLGVVLARWDTVLLTDVDHIVPPETFAGLLLKDLRPDGAFIFTRFERGVEITAHAGTVVISRARFLQSCGFDEDFCGHYGLDDVHFLRRQRSLGTRFSKLPHSIEVLADESRVGHRLDRDTSFNANLLERKSLPDLGVLHAGRMLRFAWEVLHAGAPGLAGEPARRTTLNGTRTRTP